MLATHHRHSLFVCLVASEVAPKLAHTAATHDSRQTTTQIPRMRGRSHHSSFPGSCLEDTRRARAWCMEAEPPSRVFVDATSLFLTQPIHKRFIPHNNSTLVHLGRLRVNKQADSRRTRFPPLGQPTPHSTQQPSAPSPYPFNDQPCSIPALSTPLFRSCSYHSTAHPLETEGGPEPIRRRLARNGAYAGGCGPEVDACAQRGSGRHDWRRQ